MLKVLNIEFSARKAAPLNVFLSMVLFDKQAALKTKFKLGVTIIIVRCTSAKFRNDFWSGAL